MEERKMSAQEIIEAIEKMSLMEINELVEALKEKLCLQA